MPTITLKKDEDKIKTIIDYYVLTNKLKDVIRSGWKKWNIKKQEIKKKHVLELQQARKH